MYIYIYTYIYICVCVGLCVCVCVCVTIDVFHENYTTYEHSQKKTADELFLQITN